MRDDAFDMRDDAFADELTRAIRDHLRTYGHAKFHVDISPETWLKVQHRFGFFTMRLGILLLMNTTMSEPYRIIDVPL